MEKILVATSNRGKVAELQSLLKPLQVELIGLWQFPDFLTAEETGDTLEANALLKAQAGVRQTGLPSLADDSGLFVTALAGQPGVYSARFAGPEATDAENNQLLMEQMAVVYDRSASFISVVVLVLPSGEIYSGKGVIKGEITLTPQGEQGFGYDPYFYVPSLRKTFAEMNTEEKNQYSHRGLAVENLLEQLMDK